MHENQLLQRAKAYSAYLEQASYSGVSFLFQWLLATLLPAAVFGHVSTILLWGLLLVALHQAWIQSPLQTLLATRAPMRYKYVLAAHGLTAWLLLAVLLTGSMLAIIGVISWAYPWVLATQLLSDYHRRLLLFHGKWKQALFFGWWPVIAILVLITGGEAIQHDATAPFLLSVPLPFLLFTGWRQLRSGWQLQSRAVTFYFGQMSLWGVGTQVLTWLSGNHYLLRCGYLLGDAMLAPVRAAQNVVGPASVLFTVWENHDPGKFGKAKDSGSILLKKILQVYYKRWLLFGALVAFLYLLAPLLNDLLFGAHLDMAGLLQILLLSYFVSSLSMPFRVYLRMHYRTFPLFLSYVIAAAAALVLADPMLLHFGNAGAAYGFVISQLIQLLVLLTYLTIKPLPNEGYSYQLRQSKS
jgi:hypothetical protein